MIACEAKPGRVHCCMDLQLCFLAAGLWHAPALVLTGCSGYASSRLSSRLANQAAAAMHVIPVSSCAGQVADCSFGSSFITEVGTQA